MKNILTIIERKFPKGSLVQFVSGSYEDGDELIASAEAFDSSDGDPDSITRVTWVAKEIVPTTNIFGIGTSGGGPIEDIERAHLDEVYQIAGFN